MKFQFSLAAVTCLVAGNSNAFAPVSSSPKQSTTTLNLRSDQEMFDNISLQNGGYGNTGMRHADGGYELGSYRDGGRGYFPSYSRGGSLARYQPNYYTGYDMGYNGYGTSGYIAGRDRGYNNGYGYDYGYNNYDYGYDHGYGNTVQGNSRRTYSTSHSDASTVQLETDGRPLNANVEVWQGAGNSPAKMRLYSEDGARRPWTAGFANTGRGGYSTAMTVNNEASQSFPLRANVANGGGYGASPYGGMGGYGSMGGYGMGGGMSSYTGSSRQSQVSIDGGALKTFSFGPARAVVIEIWSEDFPFYADVELWDGPSSVKQAAEVYSDSGRDRPWSAVIENPRGGTVSVRNVGPLEFPMKVCVEPIY